MSALLDGRRGDRRLDRAAHHGGPPLARGGEDQDQRDREIHHFGEYIGQSFVVIGGVAGLVLAMAEVDQFWIANAIYLAFVLSALLGSAAKIVAYRLGFPAVVRPARHQSSIRPALQPTAR
ncbi:hypothetical protein [Streptomyces sp. NBC_01294]|uniref:hypothetical protein n=1 Tax=Streptomyces sp. NBC_01294 TaxID=2903815 RepID=UPI002DDB6288|nr:hypothetical protein [Streptomyces sp. NBC_01294]WRZ55217.1 hypothetical protein OG534_01135 [Streptomyces sp. NBC_01294]